MFELGQPVLIPRCDAGLLKSNSIILVALNHTHNHYCERLSGDNDHVVSKQKGFKIVCLENDVDESEDLEDL